MAHVILTGHSTSANHDMVRGSSSAIMDLFCSDIEYCKT